MGLHVPGDDTGADPDGPGGDHLVVPARDVDEDLAHAPGPEPDAAHLLVAQPLDRFAQLGERLVGVAQQHGLLARGVAHAGPPDWWSRPL